MKRFPRTLAEAFPSERYAAIQGPYKRTASALIEAVQTVAILAAFAGLGVLIAWRF